MIGLNPKNSLKRLAMNFLCQRFLTQNVDTLHGQVWTKSNDSGDTIK